MYAKRGGVAAYHIVWIGLCLRSVPGVRVLASAVDDCTNAITKKKWVLVIKLFCGDHNVGDTNQLQNLPFNKRKAFF